MGDVTESKSGTLFVDGVEYNTYPPPGELVKAMQRKWAERLCEAGVIRFGSLQSYRTWESKVLGDPNDGSGMLRLNGHPCVTGSSNPVYVWCAAKPDIPKERLLLLAEDGDYDCVAKIRAPLLFIERVKDALLQRGWLVPVHCGDVTYNRGAEVDKRMLNSQKFHFNVFQKDACFSQDCEYRLAITDGRPLSKLEEYVQLEIGDCSDIVTLEALPD